MNTIEELRNSTIESKNKEIEESHTQEEKVIKLKKKLIQEKKKNEKLIQEKDMLKVHYEAQFSKLEENLNSLTVQYNK